jgi:hypothetical protein
MHYLTDAVVNVADRQIKHLAQRSQELNQETRVTLYTFNEEITCITYDMDVLRLPSIRDVYNARGMTALVKATQKSIDDLRQTATLYGDHAFLVFVMTDGQENSSGQWGTPAKSGQIRNLQLTLEETSVQDEWTVAALVPDFQGRQYALNYGFLDNNIAIWETTESGVREVGEKILQATDNYMVARSKGVRSSSNLFQIQTDNLSKSVLHSQLKPMPYQIFTVDTESQIRDFVQKMTGEPYEIGSTYYQLTKPEDIRPNREICIREKKTGQLYGGAHARKLLGLPDYLIRVQPNHHADYDIFVKSKSVNRKLVPNTNVVLPATPFS